MRERGRKGKQAKLKFGAAARQNENKVAHLRSWGSRKCGISARSAYVKVSACATAEQTDMRSNTS